MQDRRARSRQVVGGAEPRLDLRRQRRAEASRNTLSGAHHPVVRVAGTRHVGADEHRVLRLAGHRIERHPGAVDDRRQVQPRRLRRIVARRVEVRDLIVDPHVRRVPDKARAVVQRQPRPDDERVLRVEFGHPGTVARLAVAIGLGVLREYPEQRVGVGETGVERVVGVAREVVLAHPGAAARLVVLHVLEIAAGLERVARPGPGEVVAEPVDPVACRVADAVVVGEVRRFRAGDVDTEEHSRNQPERVQRRIQLAQVPADVAPANPRPVAVVLGLKAFGLGADAGLEFVDQVRPDDPVPAAVDRAVGKNVGGVEEAPARRRGGDLRSVLIGIECAQRAPDAVAARRSVVEAQQVVEAGIVRRLLPAEVVGEALAVAVRQRHHVEQPLHVRIDAALWNDVAGKRLPCERIDHGDGAPGGID